MLVRVAEPNRPAFHLRKGEEGLSVFDTEAVQPPLGLDEALSAFRPGSVAVLRSGDEIEAKGLRIMSIPGAEILPDRLRAAHAELQAGPGMNRAQFKQALKELE